MQIFQTILDILRLKILKQNSFLLSKVLNFIDIFEHTKSESKIKNAILRFCGAKIGKNVKIYSNVFIHNPQNLIIDDNVYIGNNSQFWLWTNKVHIKKYSFTSVNCTFLCGSHNVNDYETVFDNQEIVVEEGCWIGANSTILGGAHIGKSSIVGACSMLKGTYQEFSIIAGIPTVIKKKRECAEIIKLPIEYNIEEIIND